MVFVKKYIATLFSTHLIAWMTHALSLALLLSLCVSCSSIPKNDKGNAEIMEKNYAWNSLNIMPMDSLRHLPFENGHSPFLKPMDCGRDM